MLLICCSNSSMKSEVSPSEACTSGIKNCTKQALLLQLTYQHVSLVKNSPLEYRGQIKRNTEDCGYATHNSKLTSLYSGGSLRILKEKETREVHLSLGYAWHVLVGCLI